MSKKGLFSEFQEVSAKEWKQKIQVDLKGADYNETLVWESPEGIKVKPFYHSDDAVATPQNLKAKSTWKISRKIYAGEATKANTIAKQALGRGAESLVLVIPSKDIAIKPLLKDIDLSIVPISFEFQFLSQDYIQTVVDFFKGCEENLFLNLDPIGHLAREGNWFESWEKDFAVLENVLTGPAHNVLSIDLSLYQNAGANRAQQLAYALAHANEYLNAFDNDKQQPKAITFQVSVGSNYFFEIAKLRALRQLWESLTSAYGLNMECRMVAYPTKRNKTLYDYNVNMVRTTTECMCAILGGADTVYNLAYDAIYHKENEFGNRIALNQLLLLKNESYFDKVDNTADGSYYIESITNQLAEKALELFKSIEKGGGFLKQLKEHTIQRKIAESAAKEQAKFDAGEKVLVGTNKYQNEEDKMKETMELYPFLKTNPRKTLLQPILEKRLAEAVEQKRLDDE